MEIFTILLIVATLLSGALGVYYQKYLSDKHLEKELIKEKNKIKIFEPPEGQSYNKEFYDYFLTLIKNTRNCVYITGEGFSMKDVESRNLATELTSAFSYILSQGKKVVRIQTDYKCSKEWVEHLISLKNSYDTNFELYVLDKHNMSPIGSICSIDPEEPNYCVVELMIENLHIVGSETDSINMASTALFIHNRIDIAMNFRKKIFDLMDSRNCRKLNTVSDIESFFFEREYYFAYGSNVSDTQMLKRCPSAKKIGIAVLLNHALCFNRKGTYRNGGVASVSKKENHKVYGVLWELNPSDLQHLDKIEDTNAYHREKYDVYLLDGSVINSNIYISYPEGSHFQPDSDYLNLIIQSSEEANLPPEYIKFLKSFE